jgi:hypothetical protein
MGTSVGKYENRTWMSNNITWTATNVRTDVKDADSKVIVMKSGKLTSSPLKMDYLLLYLRLIYRIQIKKYRS